MEISLSVEISLTVEMSLGDTGHPPGTYFGSPFTDYSCPRDGCQFSVDGLLPLGGGEVLAFLARVEEPVGCFQQFCLEESSKRRCCFSLANGGKTVPGSTPALGCFLEARPYVSFRNQWPIVQVLLSDT